LFITNDKKSGSLFSTRALGGLMRESYGMVTKNMHFSFDERYASFLLPILLLLTDYIAIIFAEAISYILRRDLLPMANANFFIPTIYFYIIVPCIFLCFLHSANTHIRNTPFWKMAKNIFRATLYSLLTIVMLMYFGKVAEVVSRLYVGMTWGFSFVLILTMRYILKQYLNSKKILQIPVLFIGAGKTAELVLRSFDHDSGFGYRVVGFIDDHPVSDYLKQKFDILGGFKDTESIIKKCGIQSVIITAPGLSPEKFVNLINRIQPHVRNVAFIPALIGTPLSDLEVESLVDEKIMMLKVKNNLARPYNRMLKRVFDLSVSLCCLFVAVPLGIVLSLFICFDTSGPAIFAHRRIGRNGKAFPCYKFRTMVLHADEALEKHFKQHPEAREEWQRDFKLKNDPRITRVGDFLRKTSLDELPQLLNVLKGEMSLVGPRPIVKEEIEKYGDFIHDFYLVPPGITGMWQVNGRSDTTYEERVSMDSWYVRNWSVWIDMVYLLKTIKVVFIQKGAY
jgi:undecaprenyl-phosphate galactose phosphotransferase